MIGYPDERDMEQWRTGDAAAMGADLDRVLGAGSSGSSGAAARPVGGVEEASRPPSDTELMQAVRDGNTQAYGDLYARHVRAAHNLARQLVRTPTEADDLVSDAFAKVLATLRTGGGPEVAFRAYVLTAVRHTAYDRTRRDRRIDLADDVESVPAAKRVTVLPFHDTSVARLERTLAARAFADLPERWQTVLWHTAIEGQPPDEVAPLLGLTANGVSALAYRAREGLRKAYIQAHVAHAPSEHCRAAVTKLGAWTRNGLSRRETSQVEAHLDSCGACRALASELADINSSLRGVVAPLVLGVGAAGYLAATGKATAATALLAASGSSALPWIGAAAAAATLVIAVMSTAAGPPGAADPTVAADPPASSAGARTTGPIGQSGPAVTGSTAPSQVDPSAGAPSAGAPSAGVPNVPTSEATAGFTLAPTTPGSFVTSTGGPPTRLPITITNTGSAPAPPTTLTLSLPEDVKVVGPGNNLVGAPLVRLNGVAQQTVSCPAGKVTVTCASGQQLAPGESVTFVFRLLAGPKAVSGTIIATTDSAVPLRMEVPVTITPKK